MTRKLIRCSDSHGTSDVEMLSHPKGVQPVYGQCNVPYPEDWIDAKPRSLSSVLDTLDDPLAESEAELLSHVDNTRVRAVYEHIRATSSLVATTDVCHPIASKNECIRGFLTYTQNGTSLEQLDIHVQYPKEHYQPLWQPI